MSQLKDGEWWTGRLYDNDSRGPGLFPSNYVELIEESELPKKAAAPAARKPPPKATVRKALTSTVSSSGFGANGQFSFGDAPVWQYRSFNDIFLHPYLGTGTANEDQDLQHGTFESGMESLAEVLRLVYGARA
jgi:hypothetical protein